MENESINRFNKYVKELLEIYTTDFISQLEKIGSNCEKELKEMNEDQLSNAGKGYVANKLVQKHLIKSLQDLTLPSWINLDIVLTELEKYKK